MKRLSVVLAILVGLALPSQKAAQGNEFQVNTYTTDNQFHPAVAANAQGDFVVVWASFGSRGTDTSLDSIQARRYAANGQALGGQFQVNSYTTNRQNTPAVAMDSQGDIIVVWESRGSPWTDTQGDSIQGQRYAANGAPLGGQFQVNDFTYSDQDNAAVASDSQGNFVVVWESYGSPGTDSDYYSIQAQRYDANGAPVGGQFQVNSYTTEYQLDPDVATDPQGNFVVVWYSFGSNGTDTDSASIQAQRYDANGTPQGSQFQVNTYTIGLQTYPLAAIDPNGNFVLVWSSNGSSGTDTSGESIQAQRFDAGGNPVGGQFQVNTYSTGMQIYGGVTTDAQGNFVVVWESDGSGGTDTSSISVQGQRFDASGILVGGQFQVNSYTTDWQSGAAVASDSQGDFVVVWASDGSNGTDWSYGSIQGRQYELAVFSDSFESGDTSAWSSTVQ